MGRGRAKAKQTKVARQLKYNSPEMDLDSLQRELAGEKQPHDTAEDHSSSSYEDDDEFDYSEYAERYADWDEDSEEDSSK